MNFMRRAGMKPFKPLAWVGASLVFLIFVHFSFPAPDFVAPLDIDLRLSGTFGELRSNHFHAGIDLKSPNGQVGTPVLAAADGFIHRIKVKGGGYGQALYIDHGNGYSTVYAHLDAFTDELGEYVRGEQYRRKSFVVNLFPAAGRFRVAKGELIGYMGNSGHSYGPHLHFEIRRFGIPVNPLAYLAVSDETRPVFRNLYFHWFNQKKTPLRRQKTPMMPTPDDTLEVAGGLMGMSVYAYDPQNEGANKNGLYELKMYLDDRLVFHSKYDKVPFSKTRYANAHMDYPFKIEDNVKPYALFRLPGNQLRLYEKIESDGFFVPERQAQEIRLVAQDFSGNSNELRFYLCRKEDQEVNMSDPFQHLLRHDSENNISRGRLKLFFPQGALYHDMHFSMAEEQGFFNIGTPLIPLHKYIQLSYDLSPGEYHEQLFLAYCPENDRVYNAGGQLKGGKLVASVRQFGPYTIEVDSVAPEIDLRHWKIEGKTIRANWRLSDNYPATGKAKDLTYQAQLDSEWTLMRFDAKSNSLFWDETCTPGKHLLEILVTDSRGNENRFTKSFSI